MTLLKRLDHLLSIYCLSFCRSPFFVEGGRGDFARFILNIRGALSRISYLFKKLKRDVSVSIEFQK